IHQGCWHLNEQIPWVITSSCFQHKYIMFFICTEPITKNCTCTSSTDNNIIIFLFHSSSPQISYMKYLHITTLHITFCFIIYGLMKDHSIHLSVRSRFSSTHSLAPSTGSSESLTKLINSAIVSSSSMDQLLNHLFISG